MILEKQKEALVLSEGESQDSIGMSLDLDSAQILMQMLSKNLYSDPIGSTVRECASNALDSHRRVGSTDPIIVGLKVNSQGTYDFTVEDFGSGLDADDVKNIISKYGKSTKRQSANELGMMGLGFKAPLAYSSSFYFICRKDGVERKYMMYEGEDVNTIDLLYEQPTTEKNGVKIIVPVGRYDRDMFNSKIREQLAYFENVYFDVPGIDNNFAIIRTDLFQWSPLSKNNQVHLCLDNVYYPLDFPKLGIAPMNLPIGLRFSLSDGIFPVPNREQLKYTKEAQETIKKRIKEVADFFIKKHNEKVSTLSTYNDLVSYCGSSNKYVQNYQGSNWEISGLKQFSDIKFVEPVLENVENISVRDLYSKRSSIAYGYEKTYQIRYGVSKEMKNRWQKTVNVEDILNNTVLICTEFPKGAKKVYIKERYQNAIVIKQFTKRNLKAEPGNYIDSLDLNRKPKDKWRAIIKDWEYFKSLVFNKVIDLDALEVPKDWLELKKQERLAKKAKPGYNAKQKKMSGEVVGKVARPLQKWVAGKECLFERTVISLKDAYKEKKITIFTGEADEAKLDKLYTVVKRDKIRLVTFSPREMKAVENIKLHNWITLEQFMKGENKSFKRIVTSNLVRLLIAEYPAVFDKRETLEQISTDLASDLKKLVEYKENWHVSSSKEIQKAMLEVAVANNAFDPEIYDVYKKITVVLKRLKFLQPILGAVSLYSMTPEVVSSLKDLFKYYKMRMDWKNYNIDIVEPILEEEVEEETETEKIEETF